MKESRAGGKKKKKLLPLPEERGLPSPPAWLKSVAWEKGKEEEEGKEFFCEGGGIERSGESPWEMRGGAERIRRGEGETGVAHGAS